MQRSLIPLFFLLIALFSSWNSGKAQASDALPDQIQGHWAVPDCRHYDEALLLTRYFYLESTDNDLTLRPASLRHRQKDYWVLTLSEALTPVRLESDGILKIGTLAEDSPQKPKSWADFIFDQQTEYASCVERPRIMPKLMVRLMRFIDRIAEQCTLSLTNDCTRVLFKFADANANQKLTASEIKRAVTSLMLFAEMSEKGTLTDEESENIIARAKVDGEAIADDLHARLDKNGSKDLDYNELAESFTPPALPVIKDMLLKAGSLLPAFKVAGMSLPNYTEDGDVKKPARKDY